MARLALAGASIVAALIIAAIAISYLGAALLLALETTRLGPAAATLITGVIGLVVAALVALVARRMACPRNRAHAPAPARSSVNDVAAELGGFIAQQVTSSARSHPYGTIGAALAAGLAVGALPELRKLLTDVFKG